MTPRPWILAETNWKSVAATEYAVAILPWGATEAHSYQLASFLIELAATDLATLYD